MTSTAHVGPPQPGTTAAIRVQRNGGSPATSAPGCAPSPIVSRPLSLAALPEAAAVGVETLRQRAEVSWEHPRTGTQLFGFGRAVELRAPADAPLAGAAPALRAAFARIAPAAGLSPDARPRFFGGARFVPAGPARDPAWEAAGGWRFVLPALIVAIRDGVRSASCHGPPGLGEAGVLATARTLLAGRPGPAAAPTTVPEPGPGLTPSEWAEMVERALGELRQGTCRKVVLARLVDLEIDARGRKGEVLTRLAQRYPGCFVFSFDVGQATWLGASPELLCRVDAGRVEAASLAGSRPRGSCEDHDRALARELMASPKERAEHDMVVVAVRQALEAHCGRVEAPLLPALVQLSNIQHLHTPVTGGLRGGKDVLDVLCALHPTPAVGGLPRPAALDAIERLEGLDRGWYAGPVGWVDVDGDGEFAVGLRSALLLDRRARLYAGAGIVEGSIPADEFAETETKLTALRDALDAPLR